MKTTSTILALSFAAFLFSCEIPEEINDDKPRIQSISIAGIPDKNIEFIPERYVINVQLPGDAPQGGFKPTFQLTENTEFLEGVTPDGKFSRACGSYILKVANDKKTAIYQNITSYQINFKPAPGCPEVLGNVPITYSRDSSNAYSMQIQVPLKNPFSAFKVYSVRLKNRSTGQVHDNTLPSYLISNNYLNRCPSGIDSRISLFFPQVPPGPGTYELSLSMTCGEGDRTLTFPQPLVLKE